MASIRRHWVRKLAAVASTVVIAAACSTAYAYINATGSGSGSGSVSASTTVTISGGTTTQTLIPATTPTGDVVATITNGTGSRVRFNSLVLDADRGSGGYSPNASSCGVSYTTQTNVGTGWSLAAGSTSSIDLTNSVTMATTAPSSCSGSTFTIFLKTA